jgi:hypothetical protein
VSATPAATLGAWYGRVGLRVAWTRTNQGEAAKRCDETGVHGWKAARTLSSEPGAAAGFFATRIKTRNPVVPAVANGLVLLDFDGGLGQLARRYGLEQLMPSDAWRVATAEGTHVYLSAPAGRRGVKVELTPERVTISTDGYLLGPGGRHPDGLVYELANVDLTKGSGRPPTASVELYERLLELGDRSRERVAELVDSGEPIAVGDRHASLLHHAGKLRAEGLGAKAITAALEELAERFTEPLERGQELDKLVSWVMAKPAPPPLDATDAELLGLLEELPHATPRPAEAPAKEKPKRRLRRRPLAVVKAAPVEYVIEKKVPARTLTLVAGVGGLGKSALSLAWGKQVTDAGGNVLVVSYEDATAQVIRPRFEALGGNLELLHELYVADFAGEVSFPADLHELDRHVRETSARMVLIDPVSASIDLKLDAHRDQDVRVVLGQLARLADREGLAIVANAHLNKAPSTDPYLRINGSTAFYNAARSVLTVTRDPAEPDWQRLIAHHKSNYGALAEVERWRVEPVTIDSDSGPIEVMTLAFVELAFEVCRDDVLAARAASEKLDLAVTFAMNALADGQWHDSAGLVKLAGSTGISERTLRRAALEELGVEHERRGFPAVSWWHLASDASPLTQSVGTTGETLMATEPAPSPASSHAKRSGEGTTGMTDGAHTRPGCRETRQWRARDGAWRCSSCEPPAARGEVLEERDA